MLSSDSSSAEELYRADSDSEMDLGLEEYPVSAEEDSLEELLRGGDFESGSEAMDIEVERAGEEHNSTEEASPGPYLSRSRASSPSLLNRRSSFLSTLTSGVKGLIDTMTGSSASGNVDSDTEHAAQNSAAAAQIAEETVRFARRVVEHTSVDPETPLTDIDTEGLSDDAVGRLLFSPPKQRSTESGRSSRMATRRRSSRPRKTLGSGEEAEEEEVEPAPVPWEPSEPGGGSLMELDDTAPIIPKAPKPSPPKPTVLYEPERHAGEWETKPNTRANYVVSQSSDPLPYIKGELKEPEYAIRDIEVRDMWWQMTNKIETFAKDYFSFDFHDRVQLTEMFWRLDPTTVTIISCVASGGPGGEHGWRDLFYEADKRQALVCAIIGNVLVEQVFKHPYFGGTQEEIRLFERIQTQMKDQDGFARKPYYAALIQQLLTPNNSFSASQYTPDSPFDADSLLATIESGTRAQTLNLPTQFPQHVARIVSALSTHLIPLRTLAENNTITATPPVPPTEEHSDFHRALHYLVAHAALLATTMAADPHTVYHLVPVLKEDRLDFAKMDAFNRDALKASNPHDKDTEWPSDTPAGERERAQGDKCLVQICLLAGLTTYRKGGWELPNSTPEAVLYDERFAARPSSSTLASPTRFTDDDDEDDDEGAPGPSTGAAAAATTAAAKQKAPPKPTRHGVHNSGFRARQLSPAWVYARWGRPRVFERESGREIVQGVEVHGEVAWRKGGFVRFGDVDGVDADI